MGKNIETMTIDNDWRHHIHKHSQTSAKKLNELLGAKVLLFISIIFSLLSSLKELEGDKSRIHIQKLSQTQGDKLNLIEMGS
jgi:hypothetical protein